jgi:NAD(P)-dependent dehydrogenase (short-subunit alcohol dehydrogenase family)
VAAQVNGLGRFDAVIHNAAVGFREGQRTTADGLPHVFAINTLAAYILTALIERPQRLVVTVSRWPLPLVCGRPWHALLF